MENSSWPLIAVSIVLLLLAVIFIMVRQAQEKAQHKSGNTAPSNSQPFGVNGQDQTKQKKLVMVVILGAMVAIGLVVYYIFRGDKSGGSDDGSFFPFIPIWVAIFIPLLANKKKDKQNLTDTQKRALVILVALGVLIALAGVFFGWFMNSK